MKKFYFFFLLLFFTANAAMGKIPGAYDIIKPDPSLQVPSEHSLDQVRISEVFSFTCIHCYHLNEALKPLKKKFGNKLVFTEYPIGYQTPNTNRLFYIAKTLEKSEKVKDQIFNAVFESGIRNINDLSILGYLAKANKMEKEFEAMLYSPIIAGMSNAGVDFARLYKINATPTLVIENTIKTGGNIKNLETIINALLKEPVN